MDFEGTARQLAAINDQDECDDPTVINDQDECDDPDCACHQDTGERPGDGAAEVTMTEVYDDDISWGPHHPSGW